MEAYESRNDEKVLKLLEQMGDLCTGLGSSLTVGIDSNTSLKREGAFGSAYEPPELQPQKLTCLGAMMNGFFGRHKILVVGALVSAGYRLMDEQEYFYEEALLFLMLIVVMNILRAIK